MSQSPFASSRTPTTGNGLPPLPHLPPQQQSIRQRLQDWQAVNGNPLTELLALDHAQALGTTTQIQPLSDATVDEDGDTDLDRSGYDLHHARGRVYVPGDLLELSPAITDTTPPLCIFVRQTGNLNQVVTSKGKWMSVPYSRVMSTVPAFVDASLIPPILPYLPTQEVEEAVLEQGAVIDISAPRTVTGPLVSAMTKLMFEADEIYRDNAAILDSAHDILAHPTDLRFGGVTNIADKLLGTGQNPTHPQLFAVRKAIHYAGMGFYRDQTNHKTTGLYQIRSKEQLKEIRLAREWLRQYQEAETDVATGNWGHKKHEVRSGALIVKNFVEKCKERIRISRKTRSPTHYGNVGPSSERFPATADTGSFYVTPLGAPFTDDETILVKFLEGWCVHKTYHPEPSFLALAPLLLRATGMYTDFEFKSWTGVTFLQEIGVYDPWANLWLFDVNLLLPTSQHSKPLERLASELRQMKSRDVNMKDSMADLRHDWKDLQAFSIDPPGSKEIDDAVSVQRISGSSSEFWVHTHIANPTAFLERNDVFAKMAMHLTETLYTPELVHPMLPAWMTQEMFSLKADRPCLTFSTKINLRGEILDTKIRPSMIRNVLALEYNHLPEILGTSSEATTHVPWSCVVGGEVPPRKPMPMPEVTPQQKEDLKLLHELAKAHAASRDRNGAVFFAAESPDCSVYWKDKFGLPLSFPRRNTGILTHGDPIIELRGMRCTSPYLPVDHGSHHTLVQEMMTIANLSAATWCSNRNIPVLYRGVGSMDVDIADGYKELLQPAVEKYGFIPMAVGTRYFQTYGKVLLSSTAIRHGVMGVDKYTKVTSPLRRFGDMMSHWQIEAAIRQESRMGVKTLIGANTSDQSSYLPYSRSLVDKMITRIEPRERLIRRMSNRAEHHWECLAFQRAIEFGEAPLPRRAAVVIFNESLNQTARAKADANIAGRFLDSSVKVQVKSFGSYEASKCMQDLFPGDVWECEYVAASSLDSNIYVRPIQLIRRELDPI